MDKQRSDDKKNPKKSFSVRTMEIGDIAAVYKLGEMSFTPDLWPTLYRSWDEYEVTSLFNTDGDYCLVAEDDRDDGDGIIGFVLGTVISKTGSAWSYGYIIWIASHPAWHREGVASRLVDKLVELMIEQDGIRIMMADTDPQNVKAVRFFQKKGFVDQKPHIYLSTNLEHNKNYASLIAASRAAALDAEYLKRIRKLAEEIPSFPLAKGKNASKRNRGSKSGNKTGVKKLHGTSKS